MNTASIISDLTIILQGFIKILYMFLPVTLLFAILCIVGIFNAIKYNTTPERVASNIRLLDWVEVIIAFIYMGIKFVLNVIYNIFDIFLDMLIFLKLRVKQGLKDRIH